MEIGELLKQSLDVKNIGLPAYYIKRPNKNIECVIYNYIETPKMFGDNEELASKYTVLINVYCKSGIEKNKKIVKEAMMKNGFKKKIILQPIFEENELYNIAMQFNIALKNNNN